MTRRSFTRAVTTQSGGLLHKMHIGGKIREEIFALFFVLIILALANDEGVVNKVKHNLSIQIAIGLIIIYCLYNRIPWSVSFMIMVAFAMGFSGIFYDAWQTANRSVTKIMNKDKDKDKEKEIPYKKAGSGSPSVADYLGAKVLGWIAKDKKEKESDLPVGVLKKVEKVEKIDKNVRFGKDEIHGDESDSDSDSDESMCDHVSRAFGLNDVDTDVDTDTETEPDDTIENIEKMKKNLQSYVNGIGKTESVEESPVSVVEPKK